MQRHLASQERLEPASFQQRHPLGVAQVRVGPIFDDREPARDQDADRGHAGVCRAGRLTWKERPALTAMWGRTSEPCITLPHL